MSPYHVPELCKPEKKMTASFGNHCSQAQDFCETLVSGETLFPVVFGQELQWRWILSKSNPVLVEVEIFKAQKG